MKEGRDKVLLKSFELDSKKRANNFLNDNSYTSTTIQSIIGSIKNQEKKINTLFTKNYLNYRQTKGSNSVKSKNPFLKSINEQQSINFNNNNNNHKKSKIDNESISKNISQTKINIKVKPCKTLCNVESIYQINLPSSDLLVTKEKRIMKESIQDMIRIIKYLVYANSNLENSIQKQNKIVNEAIHLQMNNDYLQKKLTEIEQNIIEDKKKYVQSLNYFNHHCINEQLIKLETENKFLRKISFLASLSSIKNEEVNDLDPKINQQMTPDKYNLFNSRFQYTLNAIKCAKSNRSKSLKDKNYSRNIKFST